MGGYITPALKIVEAYRKHLVSAAKETIVIKMPMVLVAKDNVQPWDSDDFGA
ncbi:MAG: hypothetical protein LBT81_02640 [Helicobacteraceae bacterium]|nr:hypothetical protein [Helicobacteraceae bacterium]